MFADSSSDSSSQSEDDLDPLFITRNRGYFKPVNNCQRYIMLLSRTIKSNMAALTALSERKRVSYDLL